MVYIFLQLYLSIYRMFFDSFGSLFTKKGTFVTSMVGSYFGENNGY